MPVKGQEIPATDMKQGCTSRFALAPDGTAYFATYGGVYRVRDGKGTLVAGKDDLPAELGKSLHDWHVGGSHITPDGWFYWMPGGGPNLLRLDVRTGKAEKFAGVDKVVQGLDGPTLSQTGFHTVFVVYSPRADVIFTGGGDESILRRVADGRAAHLQKDGSFLLNGKKNGWGLYSPLCLDAQGWLYTETGVYAWGGWVVRVSTGLGLPEAPVAGAMSRSKASAIQPVQADKRLIQRQPAGAFGKDVYLVAWSEGSRQINRPAADIYCTRIDARTGRRLDPSGIPVCTAPDLQEWPTVAFDGTNFLVVWEDFRSGSQYDIYAARVTPEGKVLDPNGIAVATGPWNQARPAAGFGNGHYLITWTDARRRPVYGVFATRLTPAGKVLDPDGLALDVEDAGRISKLRPPQEPWMGEHDYWWQHLASRYLPVVASNGKQCLVAYLRETPFAQSGRPKPSAMLVDPADGRVTAGPVQLPGGAYDTLAACATPKGWAVVLADQMEGWDLASRLAVVRLDDRLQTGDAFAKVHTKEADRLPAERLQESLMPKGSDALSPGKGAICFWRPAAAWDGRQIVAAQDFGWRNHRDPNAITRVIAANRATLDATGFAEARCHELATSERTDGAVAHPSLVSGPGGQVLVVYEQDQSLGCQVIETRVIQWNRD